MAPSGLEPIRSQPFAEGWAPRCLRLGASNTKSIRTAGGSTSGVRLLNLEPEDKVASDPPPISQ
jgi:hypothetical protein